MKIIKARPGKNTAELVLEAIQSQPNGIKIKDICNSINRPPSMVQVCLKSLKSSKQIYSKLSSNKMSIIYYPKSKKNS